jgi:hypothetical protein
MSMQLRNTFNEIVKDWYSKEKHHVDEIVIAPSNNNNSEFSIFSCRKTCYIIIITPANNRIVNIVLTMGTHANEYVWMVLNTGKGFSERLYYNEEKNQSIFHDVVEMVETHLGNPIWSYL